MNSFWIAVWVAVTAAQFAAPLPIYHTEEGVASWYGEPFHGRPTKSGEIYNMYDHTAAHPSAPFGSIVRVVRLTDKNGNKDERTTVVRINDLGPNQEKVGRDRIIDLSLAAAVDIGLTVDGTPGDGLAKVRLEFLGPPLEETEIFVQAGAFSIRDNAKKRAEMVEDLLDDVPVEIKRSRKFHRVWLGPFEDEDEAAEVVTALRKKGIGAFILRR